MTRVPYGEGTLFLLSTFFISYFSHHSVCFVDTYNMSHSTIHYNSSIILTTHYLFLYQFLYLILYLIISLILYLFHYLFPPTGVDLFMWVGRAVDPSLLE